MRTDLLDIMDNGPGDIFYKKAYFMYNSNQLYFTNLTVGQNRVLRIRIRIPNMDPDPEWSIEYGSRRNLIRNTGILPYCQWGVRGN